MEEMAILGTPEARVPLVYLELVELLEPPELPGELDQLAHQELKDNVEK